MAGGYSVTFSVVDNATKQIDAINRRITQMRAPMDRLSRQVSRFVDVSGLRKVAQGFDWIGKAAGSVLRTLSTIVPVMGAITGAASIAGMVKLVQSYANWSHELVATADNIGTTTQQLQQFQDATALAGGNAGDMTASLKGLHDTLGNINIGSGNAADALQWFNKLGISARDGTGHIRSTIDVLPELIEKISAMPNPLDRARAANELLGSSGDKLIETFRQTHRSFGDWFSDAGRYTELTDEQKRSLQQFTEAQGKVGVAFDHLGQGISVVVARDFTPLLTKLSEFVEKHTPDIIKAVDELSKRFAVWLEGINWKDVQAGIDKVIDGLKLIWNNLDSILKIGGTILAAGWAASVIANIAMVVAAVGTLGTALAPVVAMLALVATPAVDAAIKAVEESEAKKQGFEKRGGSSWNPFDKIPHWVNPKTGESLTEEEMRARLGADPGRGFSPTQLPNAGAKPAEPSTSGGWLERGANWLFGRAMRGPDAIQPPKGIERQSFQPTAPELTPEGKGLLTTIAAHESRGDYNVLYGGGDFSGTQFPQWAGRDNSHAAGAYQFQPATFAGVQKQRPDITDFSPANQDRAAWQLAQTDYHRRTGRDLTVDLKDPAQAQNIASTLQPTWTSTNTPGWAAELQKNLAAQTKVAALPTPPTPPATIPPPVPAAPAVPTAPAVASAAPVTVPPSAPVNGAVDVSITHKNAPPNSAVTATGSGSVNVAPVRVEHQDMASI